MLWDTLCCWTQMSEGEKLNHLVTCIVCSPTWKACPNYYSLLLESMCHSFNSFPLSSTLCRHSFNTYSHLNSCAKGSQPRSCSAFAEISHCKLSQESMARKQKPQFIKGEQRCARFPPVYFELCRNYNQTYTQSMKHGNEKGKSVWKQSIYES